jgi:serine/alanine adding enzyme
MTAATTAADERPAAPAGSTHAHAESSPGVELIEARGASQWDEFVAATDSATIYHRHAWRDIIHAVFGHETYYLAARTPGGAISGILPLVRLRSFLFGDFLVSLPYFNYGGVVAGSAAARDALLDAAIAVARERNCQHVELRQRELLPQGWPARVDKVAMVLPLPETPEDLWKSLPSKVRSDARRPARHGITCEFGGGELVQDFYAVFCANMRDLGTPVYPRAFFQAILTAFPGSASLVVARLAGRAVAAGFVLEHAGGMEIPWASSLRRFNKFGANMYMYGSLLERAVARGCRTFDFGRSTIDSGTYLFKRQWGAKPRQLYWNYWLRDGGELPRLRPDNPKFRLAVAAWRCLPLALANRIGPRVVRYLP